MSRPRKYHSDEERRLARNAQDRERYHTNEERRRKTLDRVRRRRQLIGSVYIASNVHYETSVDPPANVLKERAHRKALPAEPGCPPASYAGWYYVKAWLMQDHFARTM